MTRPFPSWQDYEPPDAADLQALAHTRPRLRFSEADDPRAGEDNRTLIRVFLLQQGIEGELYERLVEPYDNGFYLRSDGKSTPVPALKLPGIQRRFGFQRDIAAVRHDLDYYRGEPGRGMADQWYLQAQLALGARAWLAHGEYWGLRAVGWAAWYQHALRRQTVSGYGSDAHIPQLPMLEIE